MTNERYGRVQAVNVSTVVKTAVAPTLISTIDLSLGGAFNVDLSSSTAEVELVTNGAFTGGTASWTLGSGWAYGSNNVTASTTSVGSLYQVFGSLLSADVLYKVSFDIVTAQAGQTITPLLVDASGATLITGVAQSAASTGTFIQYLIGTALCKGVGFVHAAVAGGAIDNVSVKAITTLKLTNPTSGSCYLIKIINGSSPKALVQFNPYVMWAGGTPGDLTATSGAVDLYALYYDGTNYLAALTNDYRIR